jgi:hypothetical protein
VAEPVVACFGGIGGRGDVVGGAFCKVALEDGDALEPEVALGAGEAGATGGVGGGGVVAGPVEALALEAGGDEFDGGGVGAVAVGAV